MVLGVVEGQNYEVRGPIDLSVDDLVFVRTDGVEETMDSAREIYGVDRLKEFLVTNRELSAEQLVAALNADLASHANGQENEDDVTMIAIKIKQLR